jgi:hypothetical protein
MNKLITATILATLLVTPVAYANDLDKVLGAAAGAAVGSTIGKGKGRTIAMAAGALIGANLADSNRDRYYNDNEYYYGSNGIVYSRSYDSYSDMQNHFYRRCREEVPGRYEKNRGAKRAWIDGCVNRRIAEQQEYEREAYHEGSDGRHYRHE